MTNRYLDTISESASNAKLESVKTKFSKSLTKNAGTPKVSSTAFQISMQDHPLLLDGPLPVRNKEETYGIIEKCPVLVKGTTEKTTIASQQMKALDTPSFHPSKDGTVFDRLYAIQEAELVHRSMMEEIKIQTPKSTQNNTPLNTPASLTSQRSFFSDAPSLRELNVEERKELAKEKHEERMREREEMLRKEEERRKKDKPAECTHSPTICERSRILAQNYGKTSTQKAFKDGIVEAKKKIEEPLPEPIDPECTFTPKLITRHSTPHSNTHTPLLSASLTSSLSSSSSSPPSSPSSLSSKQLAHTQSPGKSAEASFAHQSLSSPRFSKSLPLKTQLQHSSPSASPSSPSQASSADALTSPQTAAPSGEVADEPADVSVLTSALAADEHLSQTLSSTRSSSRTNTASANSPSLSSLSSPSLSSSSSSSSSSFSSSPLHRTHLLYLKRNEIQENRKLVEAQVLKEEELIAPHKPKLEAEKMSHKLAASLPPFEKRSAEWEEQRKEQEKKIKKMIEEKEMEGVTFTPRLISQLPAKKA
ncbi:uncharacterized protein MONOS_10010 [Monocercomonoides exilis]|uniref:uncharacterized protein n=1 Tax=Monocercomonoides exilis TaxID=2049356 RepID=UPI00355992AD|nr:hypothetical protein MONOS_10010 [Monocercomonoides exilis]|eukprot:MONOS_10010.1-p1 / transcript=MONOS_10010.1 / gene=MONOS_10010 / organism=Monocercomonoides_exilis_PA203 / gene_product=unspecified product / transcript_product=unspecified product / location=Mono_scaffold00437:521-3208(+) / protein_length=535 / sequence_SO=supercontig / SO=protein_coding / is_pseudo=false